MGDVFKYITVVNFARRLFRISIVLLNNELSLSVML